MNVNYTKLIKLINKFYRIGPFNQFDCVKPHIKVTYFDYNMYLTFFITKNKKTLINIFTEKDRTIFSNINKS